MWLDGAKREMVSQMRKLSPRISSALFLIIIAIFTTLHMNDTKRKLHFFVCGFPAHGHTNPTLGVVRNLIDLGYQVTYCSKEEFRESIEKNGAHFFAYSSKSLDSLVSSKVPSPDVHKVLLKSALEILPTLLPLNDQRKFDAVIYDSAAALWGQVLGDVWKCPSFYSNTPFLFTPEDTVEYMSEFMPNVDEEYLHNRALMKEKYNLSLQSDSVFDINNFSRATRIIVYVSPELQPNSEKFQGEKYIYLGNRFDNAPQPSTTRLEAGSTIYISLGTVFNENLNLLKTLIKVLSKTKYKVIVSVGKNDDIYKHLLPFQTGSNIDIYKFVDQLDVLNKASLFITHGGMNSIYEGLYLGVPMIVIPQMQEQRFNAYRIKELNAGLLLEAKQISEADIESALKKIAVKWDDYKKESLRLRATFLSSDNNKQVAKKIENIVKNFT